MAKEFKDSKGRFNKKKARQYEKKVAHISTNRSFADPPREEQKPGLV